MQGDGGVGDVLRLHRQVLFGFDGLVQAVTPAAARHGPASVFVHDDDAPALHQIILVLLEDELGAHGLFKMSLGRGLLRRQVFRAVGVAQGAAQHFFNLLIAFVVEGQASSALVNLVMLRLEILHHAGQFLIQHRAFARRAGDDERRAGFVNQDVVHFVHDGEEALALAAFVERRRHVVAQVVEAEFVVGSVDDVAGIGLAAIDDAHEARVFLRTLASRIEDESLAGVLGARGVLQDADAEAEGVVERPHPLGVAASQVIVDGDEVDAAPGEGVEVERQGGDERLALAGLHLGDAAGVEHHAADELHVVVAQADGAGRGLAHQSKGLGQNRVERGLSCLLALFGLGVIGNLAQFSLNFCPQFVRFGAQGVVAHVLKLPGHAVDLVYNFGVFADIPLVGVAADGFDDIFEHRGGL